MATEQAPRNPEQTPSWDIGEPLVKLAEVQEWFRLSRVAALSLPLGWRKIGHQWRAPRSAVVAYANRNEAA